MNELALLWSKSVSSLVTCRGRRRIGKSTLIRQFAELSNARFIKIEGLKPRKEYGNDDELRTFASQLAAQTGCERTPPEDWLNAFIRLSRELRHGEKTVVLLDEISWLGYYDPTFADTIKIAWDNYWKVHDRLVVVLCGSVSSWIRENIIDNGEFVGRRSLDIVVNELPLSDCARFWGANADRISPTEILDVLSVTGGVPRYLEEVSPGLSAAENIRRLCFSPNGIMGLAFENLVVNNFRSLIPMLHLSGALITSAAPFRKAGRKGDGFQIDLLLQSKRFAYIVEIKRRREIGREVMDEVEQKRRRLAVARGMSTRTALVYDGHLAPSVEAEGYFDAIVPYRQLLYS